MERIRSSNQVCDVFLNFSFNLTHIKIFFTFITLLAFNISIAQNSNENWLPVNFDGSSKIYINTYGLENFKDDDIYVWVLEELEPPLELESIDTKIYKTKTYYLINTSLERYSILQVIFYDSKNNVIKNYSYERNTENINIKYSSPILKGTIISSVLNKCLEITKKM